jgi:hypothetical protein
MHDRSHELTPLARLAPAVGTALILFGVWLAKAWWFWALAPLAVAGALFGVHPLDLAYNEVLAPILGTRQLARCGAGRRYAMILATVWLVLTGFAFVKGPTLTGGILAGLMAAATFMTATLDFCMPCGVFRTLFAEQRATQQAHAMPGDDEPTALISR